MPQIPPIDDAYIDDIIKSAGPYNEAINKTQGVKLRELMKRFRDYFENLQSNITLDQVLENRNISNLPIYLADFYTSETDFQGLRVSASTGNGFIENSYGSHITNMLLMQPNATQGSMLIYNAMADVGNYLDGRAMLALRANASHEGYAVFKKDGYYNTSTETFVPESLMVVKGADPVENDDFVTKGYLMGANFLFPQVIEVPDEDYTITGSGNQILKINTSTDMTDRRALIFQDPSSRVGDTITIIYTQSPVEVPRSRAILGAYAHKVKDTTGASVSFGLLDYNEPYNRVFVFQSDGTDWIIVNNVKVNVDT